MTGVKSELKQTILATLDMEKERYPLSIWGFLFHSEYVISGENHRKGQMLVCIVALLCQKNSTYLVIFGMQTCCTHPFVTKENTENDRLYMQNLLVDRFNFEIKEGHGLLGKALSSKGCRAQNVKNLKLWNTTAILKLWWVVLEENDYLWIKWVHIFYIKKISQWINAPYQSMHYGQ